MKTLAQHLKNRFLRRNQAGQSIILLALGMIVLLAFVGLVTDVSLLFVRYNQLRRAVDAASIAAAGQVRENRDYADIALSARQFIRLHGLDPNRVLVQTCVTNPGDPELCVTPPRKYVRVIAQIESPTTFLSLIGWGTVTLEAAAVSETAVLDVALVLDTSESISRSTRWETDYVPHLSAAAQSSYPSIRAECYQEGPPVNYAPEYNFRFAGCCNDPGNGDVDLNGVISEITDPTADGDYSDLVCQPFKQVRDAARTFIQRLDFVRGDRVVFVTFDRDAEVFAPDNPSGPGTLPPLITDENIAISTLDEKIGVDVSPTGLWNYCPTFEWEPERWWTYEFIAPCQNTNLGGGVYEANSVLTNPLYIRRQAVWVMIVLSDGFANATPPAIRSGVEVGEGYGQYGYCPWWTFCDPSDPPPTGDGDADPSCTEVDPSSTPHGFPYCTDNDPLTRHFCSNAQGVPDLDAPGCDVAHYDANDYAMDMADFAGLVEVRRGVSGNFIAIYSIGFGTETEPIEKLGEATLRYLADAGDNGLIDNNWQQDCRNDGVCGNEDPNIYNPPGPCEGIAPREDCGQYWYADNLAKLERVFAEIASRLFTRLAR